MNESLTGSERRQLRAQAHHLKPVVQLGRSGLQDAQVGEIDRALAVHELIKIRLAGSKAEKKELLEELTERLQAEQVGLVGHVAILYRSAAEESPDS